MLITQKEFAERRKNILQEVGENSVIVLPAAPVSMRNHYHEYRYRQNSDFWYLTGFAEPDAVAVLLPKKLDSKYVLFCREHNKADETWDGARVGLDGAIEKFAADKSFSITKLQEILPSLLEGYENIYYPLGMDMRFDRIILNALGKIRKKIRSGILIPHALFDVRHKLHKMRLTKSTTEITLLRKAVEISANGHIQAMEKCVPGMNEYQLEAELNYSFQKQGVKNHAYLPIVGSGANSCTLHYIDNNCEIKNGDLVLIDAACEFENYAADITRTFPANGKFTGEQRAIYELVLAAQLAGISAIKPGADWDLIEQNIIKIITQGLIDLKLLQGDLDNLIINEKYKDFYMHRAGHWLGLDVHDAGSYRNKDGWVKLAPNQIRTMEPGIYISEKQTNIDKRWHNIGVRIEDDVLVTDAGNEVLSAKVPKTIEEIETVMQKK